MIPFGPQHPVLPEPIHFKLELRDEIVVSAAPQIGYVHRGIEKAAEMREFSSNVFLMERICGIC
jgi:ech hydrogenase subunit E